MKKRLNEINESEIAEELLDATHQLKYLEENDWDVEDMSPSQRVAYIANLRGRVLELLEALQTEACSHPDFTPQPQLFKDDLIHVLKKALASPVCDKGKPTTTAKELVSEYAIDKGFTGTELDEYVSRSLRKYLPKAWGEAFRYLKNHPMVLQMKETGHNTSPKDYKHRTCKGGIDHALQQSAHSTSISRRLKSMEARIAELNERVGNAEGRLDHHYREIKSTKKTVKKLSRSQVIIEVKRLWGIDQNVSWVAGELNISRDRVYRILDKEGLR